MRGPNRRSATVFLSIFLVAGCSTPLTSVTPAPSITPSLGAAAIATPTRPPEPTETPSPSLLASPSAAPIAAAVTVGAPAVTLVDGLRVRSKPLISDDSSKLEPLLPSGAPLYVLDGPVSASGYDWYEVVPLGSRSLPQGWVAVGSRTGEPWLAPGRFGCPAVPTDFKSLAALPPAVGLACFSRTPITVLARLISCNCDVDGGWFMPGWFSEGTGGPEMLVEPRMTQPPSDVGDWFWLHLDPAGQRPRTLPVGEVVELTGVFDHPDAADCTFTEMDGEPAPSQHCRLEFAVTRLVRS